MRVSVEVNEIFHIVSIIRKEGKIRNIDEKEKAFYAIGSSLGEAMPSPSVVVGQRVRFKVSSHLTKTFWWTFGVVEREWSVGAEIRCADPSRPPDWPEYYTVSIEDIDLAVDAEYRRRDMERTARSWATGELPQRQ